MTELPANWKVEALGRHLTATQYGLSIRGQSAGRCPILRMNCQVNGRVVLRDLQFVDVDDKTLAAFRLHNGDILFNRTNSFELVGRTAIFKSKREVVFASYLLRLTCEPASLCPDFLNFYLNKSETQAELKTLASRGVSQANINATKLKDFEIVVPPKPEQEKIAAALWKIQRGIEVEEKLIETTRELKQSAMRQLFTHGLRGEPQQETDIGPIPESWGLLPLEQICGFASGGTPSKAQPEFWNGPIPWASPKDMKLPRLRDAKDHISQAGLDAGSTLVPANSLFVVIRGMILMRDVPVALNEVPMAFNQDMKAILPGERVAADYLLYAFEAFKGMLFQKIGRSAHGTRTLLSSELASFLMPVPSPNEQREIADILQTIDRKISVHERKRATLQELFQTMLHQLMTAQLRVHTLALDVSDVQA